MRVFLLIIGTLFMGHAVVAQPRSLTSHLQYTTEIHSDFARQVNSVNLLTLSADLSTRKIPHWQNGLFSVETISIYRSLDHSIVDDLQGFSNIEAPSLPLEFFLLGYTHTFKKAMLFAGLRSVNHDYFISPCTELFINSSPGIYPTLAENFPLPNYPTSAMGLHLRYQLTDRLVLQSSLYNGLAHDPRDHFGAIFTINPRRDGLMSISDLTFTSKSGSQLYNVGIAARPQPYKHAELGADSAAMHYSFWANTEQTLFKSGFQQFSILLQGSLSPRNNNTYTACQAFYGVGGIFSGFIVPKRNDQLGIYFNTAYFTTVTEQVVEVTWRYPLIKLLYLHPCVQYIKTGSQTHWVGLLRLSFFLGD